MQPIQFNDQSASRAYNDYILRCKRALKILSKTDREELLLEINSHIYEYMAANSETNEMANLLDVLDRLGAPEKILKEVVAVKKIKQATKSFNPKHLIEALMLNIGNGVSYIVLFLLFIFALSFPALIMLKLVLPEHVGWFIGIGGAFAGYGYLQNTAATVEVLGDWFIPIMVLATLAIYFCVVLLLKIIKKTRSKLYSGDVSYTKTSPLVS